MNNSVAIGVVVYKPNKIRFQKTLEKLLKQECTLFLYLNSNEEDIRKLLSKVSFGKKIKILGNGKNKGLAYALNQIMEVAEEEHYEWIITMDQDSLIPSNMLGSYKKYFDNPNIGIIAPQVIDSRRKYMKIKESPEEEYVEEVITSGSCTRVSAWKKVGKFDEWLFIDLIDNEFCKRLVISGYKILRLNYLVMDQEFGEIIPKKNKAVKFYLGLSKILRNKNIARFSYKKHVNPTRVFYTARNIIYVNKKMKNYGKTAYENYHCKGYLGFIGAFLIPSFIRSDKKLEVLKAIKNGTVSGFKKDVKPWKLKKY